MSLMEKFLTNFTLYWEWGRKVTRCLFKCSQLKKTANRNLKPIIRTLSRSPTKITLLHGCLHWIFLEVLEQFVCNKVCVSEGKKYLLFGKCDMLCFLVTSVLRFALLSYYRRVVLQNYMELLPLFPF